MEEFLLAILLLSIWLAALVPLLRRRDIDIHDKLTWVVVVLVLNVLGAVIYFVFGPCRKLPDSPPDTVFAHSKHEPPQKGLFVPVVEKAEDSAAATEENQP